MAPDKAMIVLVCGLFTIVSPGFALLAWPDRPDAAPEAARSPGLVDPGLPRASPGTRNRCFPTLLPGRFRLQGTADGPGG